MVAALTPIHKRKFKCDKQHLTYVLIHIRNIKYDLRFLPQFNLMA